WTGRPRRRAVPRRHNPRWRGRAGEARPSRSASSSTRLLARALARFVARVDRDLDAAILLTAAVGVVGGHRLVLAATTRVHANHAARGEVARGRFGASLREAVVVALGADVVGMTEDEQV